MSNSKEPLKVVVVIGASGMTDICKSKGAAIGYIKSQSEGHKAELISETKLHDGNNFWMYRCGSREWNLEEKVVIE